MQSPGGGKGKTVTMLVVSATAATAGIGCNCMAHANEPRTASTRCLDHFISDHALASLSWIRPHTYDIQGIGRGGVCTSDLRTEPGTNNMQ
jgi:hypothetical protein